MLLCLFLSSTGPSSQMGLSADRVMFNITVTFSASSPTEQTVSAAIANDVIALEDDELVSVRLITQSPASGVNLGQINTTRVTIVDDDCKFIKV